MSTQFSETTVSWIGPSGADRLYFTLDGTSSGLKLLVLFEQDEWSGVRKNTADVLAGLETQEFDIGGTNHTAGWPITLKIRGVSPAWRAKARAMRDAMNTTYPAEFNLAATDGSSAERKIEFAAVRWLELEHASAPDYTNRFAANFYRDVTITLASEA